MRASGFPVEYEGPIDCRICGESKAHGEFYKRGNRRRTECRTCMIAKSQESADRIDVGDKRWVSRRSTTLRRKYGITQAQFEQMQTAQGGGCAICGRAPEPRRANTKTGQTWTGLAVDHDHKTGKVRGLLCLPCNTTLGRVEDIGLDVISAYLGG